jgi:hypothetical protein
MIYLVFLPYSLRRLRWGTEPHGMTTKQNHGYLILQSFSNSKKSSIATAEYCTVHKPGYARDFSKITGMVILVTSAELMLGGLLKQY